MASFWPKNERVTVIIPAYNEEKYIGNVLKQLKACQKRGLVHDIVVVSDGSTDKTAEVAKSGGAKVVELKRNWGKARALVSGVRFCKRKLGTTIVLMLDADLKKVTPKHVEKMVKPLISLKKIDMVVGTVKNVRTDYSGQRAIRMRAFNPLFKNVRSWMKRMLLTGYGLEHALNYNYGKRALIVRTEFGIARKIGGLKVGRVADITRNFLSHRGRDAEKLREARGKGGSRKELIQLKKNLQAKRDARYSYLSRHQKDLNKKRNLLRRHAK